MQDSVRHQSKDFLCESSVSKLKCDINLIGDKFPFIIFDMKRNNKWVEHVYSRIVNENFCKMLSKGMHQRREVIVKRRIIGCR